MRSRDRRVLISCSQTARVLAAENLPFLFKWSISFLKES